MTFSQAKARAIQLIANNWTMRARYPHITRRASLMGYDVPMMNPTWGYAW